MSNMTLEQFSILAEKSWKTHGGLFLSGAHVLINLPVAPLSFLYSGWQSWSLTAWVEIDRPVRPMRPSGLHPLQTDPRYANETRPHGSWYAAVEFPNGQVLLLGALGLDSHVRLEGQALTGWYESGGGEWFLAIGEETEIFARYAALLSERLGKGRVKKTYRVWCSWYSLYTEINEERLVNILTGLKDLPFDVFQVDDGWQICIGDWEANKKFPSGMQDFATRIKATGRKAGLWLAPLLVTPSSEIYQDHPDWLLHDENGGIVSAGFNWNEPLFALDTTVLAALDWLAALMKKIRGWGYDYVKLDFLYAGALPGKRRVDMPREAAYRNGLHIIREALGDAYFLTCGAPILPSIGLCDAMRIGPDVAGYWTSSRDEFLLMNFTTPGVRNALRTTLNRLWLRPLFHPDPDVAYFRSCRNEMTPEQMSLLQDMALICNFKATSDISSWLTDQELSALREFLEAHPRIQKLSRNCYSLDGRMVDFEPYIGLPPLPGRFTNFLGTIMEGLANHPSELRVFVNHPVLLQSVDRLFDWLLKISLKK